MTDMIERSNTITRNLRNYKINKWLDGEVSDLVIIHHINFVWGKK